MDRVEGGIGKGEMACILRAYVASKHQTLEYFHAGGLEC